MMLVALVAMGCRSELDKAIDRSTRAEELRAMLAQVADNQREDM